MNEIICQWILFSDWPSVVMSIHQYIGESLALTFKTPN